MLVEPSDRLAEEVGPVRARLPGGPPSAGRFAAFARQHAGHLAVALQLWAQVRQTSENRYLRDMAEREIARIQEALETGRHDAAVQQLAGVAALEAKLTIPVEAEQFYRLENQEVAVELAVFWGTNFQDKVELTPEKVGLYYTNSQARYRVPERAVLSYVEFPATNFLAEADQKLGAITNLEEQIEKKYYQQGTNSFQDTNGVVLSADAAKARIREETRLQLGLRAAHQKANELGTKLSEQSETNQTENLERLAAATHLHRQLV